MPKLKCIVLQKNESVIDYVRRMQYAIHRRILPSLRQKHYLEELVGPIGYWEPLQAYQFEFLKTMGLQPYHSLLDIGCGPLQGGIKLIDYLETGQYTGIDLRQKSIIAAYSQVIQHNLVHKNPALIMSDSFGRKELENKTFDYFWMSQLLYHLTLEQVEALFVQVASQMTPTSVFYGDIVDYNAQSDTGSHWQEFKFFHHQPSDLKKLAKKAGLRIEILGQIGDFGYPRELELSNNYAIKISPRISVCMASQAVEELSDCRPVFS